MPTQQDVIAPDGSSVYRKPRAGDLQWDGRAWRRWSGRKWATAAYSLTPEQLTEPLPLHHRARLDEDSRRRALSLAVEHQIAANGASVVFEGPSGVVLAYRRPVPHGLHALATLLTAGLWAIVWVVAAVSRSEDRVRLEPDPWGNVWARPTRAL